jgi:DNA topoisomerase-1
MIEVKKRTQKALSPITTDPKESAQAVGLRYIAAGMPGIHRQNRGTGFQYVDASGKIIRDPHQLRRIKSLVIPPAWTQVWICQVENGHLQATGRDAKGRKQYRYHPRWRETRDETKYTRMLAFAEALPKIRRRIRKDLSQPGLSRRKVLATIVRLLEVSLIRVGNEEYARHNHSFGLTRDRHVNICGSTLRFHFRGKSGKEHTVDIQDRRLAKLVKSCQDLPGQELFQYIDDQGQRQKIGSGDVNEYLRELTEQDFTAKDFRTWAGSVMAAMALQEFEKFDSQAHAKRNIVRAIETVAQRLGNTPAICRKSYVHPAILDSYLDGTMMQTLKEAAEKQLVNSLVKLRPEEAAVLALLRQRLTLEEHRPEKLFELELKRRRGQRVATERLP